MTTREEFITGLRQLADFLTVNPDVPVPPYSTDIHLSTFGSDDECVGAVDAFALASGAEPVWNEDGTHYRAALRFGPIRYYTVAVTKVSMDDYYERERLGKEALAAKKAAAHQDEADWAALAETIADDEPTAAEPVYVPQEPSIYSDPAVRAAVRGELPVPADDVLLMGGAR
jgi:hypothetical protein